MSSSSTTPPSGPVTTRGIALLLGSRRRAALTVLAWLAAVVLLTVLAPSLDSVEDNSTVNLPPAASGSMVARAIEAREFPDDRGVPAVVVVHDPAGLGRHGSDVTARLGEDLADLHPAPPALSEDGTTAVVVVTVQEPPSSERFHEVVDRVRDIADQAEAGAGAGAADLTVDVTGPAGISRDAVEVFGRGDAVLLAGTVALVLALLLLVYRSPLLALVPLVAATVAIRTTEALGGLAAQAGLFGVNSQTASIMTVLLFGIGTDYTLLLVARHREALAAGDDLVTAMGRAVAGVLHTLVFSASTVVLAMLALLLAVSPALRGFGPLLALSVVVMLAAALTLVPALVLLCGRAVFWPRRAGTEQHDSRTWARVARLVQSAPRRTLAASTAFLAVASLGLAGYSETYDLVSGFRVETGSAQGQQVLERAFPPGELTPTQVYVDLSGTDAGRAQAAALAQEVGAQLAGVDAVARVSAPTPSTDGDVARLSVTLDSGPYGARAMDAVDELRAVAGDAAAGTGLPAARVHVGGETATSADLRAALHRDLWVLVPAVLVTVLLLLALMLRSLLAPLYLATSILVSFAATMGITTFLTTTVLGDDGIGSRVSAYVFVFLVALGVDYNIFVMDRLRQELRHGPLDRALRTAVVRTGGVVTSAGLVLAGTFLVLTTQPVRELFQFGLAMAVGILVDTLLVRTLVVPATVRLLARHALWPRRISPADAPAHDVRRPPAPGSPPARCAGRPPATTAAGRAPR